MPMPRGRSEEGRGEPRLSEVIAALRWYADQGNYLQSGWQGDPEPPPVMRDNGKRAKAALAGDWGIAARFSRFLAHVKQLRREEKARRMMEDRRRNALLEVRDGDTLNIRSVQKDGETQILDWSITRKEKGE
jgi:hypothetical protein